MPTQKCGELYNGISFWRKIVLNFLNMELFRTNSDLYQKRIFKNYF